MTFKATHFNSHQKTIAVSHPIGAIVLQLGDHGSSVVVHSKVSGQYIMYEDVQELIKCLGK